MKKLFALMFVAVLAMVAQAGATLVTSITDGSVFTFPAMNQYGGGPITFASGITWSSTNSNTQGGSVFGLTTGYQFGSNGAWTPALGPIAGVNDSYAIYSVTDTMTFAFATPVSAVGGFLNYYPDGATTPTIIAVYDSSCDPRISSCTPLDSAILSFSTGGANDSGQFYGFQEPARNISYFTLTDNYIAITEFTAVVPEPSSLLLIGTGLLGVVGYGRRRLGL